MKGSGSFLVNSARMATPEYSGGVAEAATRRRLYGAAVVGTLLALAVLGTVLRTTLGFPLDDSWIHQTVARNLAVFGSLGYLPHQRSSGSTSLLWTVVLALKYLAVPGVSAVGYALVVNAACLVGVVLLLLRMALRDRMRTGLALLWAVAPLADGNFVWLAFTGMEHVLFVFLSLLSVDLWAAEETSAVWAGIAMGLLAMTRPEGMVLGVAMLLMPGLARRTRGDALRALVPAAVLAAVPFGVNLFTSHALLPLTFKGRQWLYLGNTAPSLGMRLRLFGEWFHRALYAVKAPQAGGSVVLARGGYFLGSSALLCLSGAGLWSLWRERCRLTLMVCGWGVLHSLLYVVVLPTSGHGGRYQPFVLMLLVPLSVRGVYGSVKFAGTWRMPVTVAVLLVFAVFSLRLWRATLRSGVAHIEESHGVMVGFLNQHLPGETLAVFDIGRIGYGYRGSVVDLGGLTDTRYAAYMLSGRVPEYLREHGIRYVVLPTEMDRSSRLADKLRITGNPQVKLELMDRACSPEGVWQLGFLQTNDAFQCQELDRVRF